MIHFLKTYIKHLLWTILLSAIVLTVLMGIYEKNRFWDDDVHRGIKILEKTDFQDGFTKLYPSPEFKDWEYAKVWQGWTPSQSMWYYTTTQGSDLIPYDIFLHLEQPHSKELFRENTHIDKYRYIPQKKTSSNEDGLPLGFVKDTYKDKEYIGFSCSACHTNQIVYNKTAIRIDGAPSMANMNLFLLDMQKAMESTLNNPEKLKRILAKMDDKYDSKEEAKQSLSHASETLLLYNTINHSDVDYGYARLDAFGRIFNRVLEYLVTKEDIIKALDTIVSEEELKEIKTKIADNMHTESTTNIYQKINRYIESNDTKRKLRESIFNAANAPVSYPFLWDTPQHDYLQWNGIAGNAGISPLGRNTGEVLGVFGTLDWHEKKGSNILSSFIGGQTNKESHISFVSSVNFSNLRMLESELSTLQSPKWPEAVLPEINTTLANKGKEIYAQQCLSCHALIEHNNSNRRVIAQMDNLKMLGTDATMARNSMSYKGNAGILKGGYVDAGIGKLYIQDEMPVAALLTAATTNVILTPDPDKWFLHRFFDWLYNIIKSLGENDIKTTLKQGSYTPATTVAPFDDLLAYKGRPLNGIWATAPYLHNGSVPTLYDLLLPQACNNQNTNECRPESFMLGSRAFDPIKVGFITSGYKGTLFDTTLKGNSNKGHEYAAGISPQQDGTIAPALNKEERLELLEYLKTL